MPVGPPPMMATLLAGHLGGGLDGGHQGVVALLGGQQLGVADADGLVIEVAAALGLAAVGTDRAGDERQGVSR